MAIIIWDGSIIFWSWNHILVSRIEVYALTIRCYVSSTFFKMRLEEIRLGRLLHHTTMWRLIILLGVYCSYRYCNTNYSEAEVKKLISFSKICDLSCSWSISRKLKLRQTSRHGYWNSKQLLSLLLPTWIHSHPICLMFCCNWRDQPCWKWWFCNMWLKGGDLTYDQMSFWGEYEP